MKQRIYLIAVFCFFVVLFIGADAKPTESKSLGFTSEVTIFQSDLSHQAENRYSIKINWRAGKKKLLSFAGQTYDLCIVCDGDGERISEANFSFKDTNKDDKTTSIRHAFKRPFAKDLEMELERLRDLAKISLCDDDTGSDKLLTDELDLRPFYRNFVKPLADKQAHQ